MGRRRAILDPTNVQDCLIKVGLLPTKIDKLGRAEPVSESDQDHRRVTVALPIVLGPLDEALDLSRRQVKGQARAIFRFVLGLLQAVPMLEQLIVRRDVETIELSNRVVIEIGVASFRSTRGYTYAAILCDELAFWR